jgi:hypothetical protein
MALRILVPRLLLTCRRKKDRREGAEEEAEKEKGHDATAH